MNYDDSLEIPSESYELSFGIAYDVKSDTNNSLRNPTSSILKSHAMSVKSLTIRSRIAMATRTFLSISTMSVWESFVMSIRTATSNRAVGGSPCAHNAPTNPAFLDGHFRTVTQ